MNRYRIYCLTDEGRFSKVHEVDAVNDSAALEFDEDIKHTGPCEVWQGQRLVGTITAKAHTSGQRATGASR